MKKYCVATIVGVALFTAVSQARAAVTTYNYTGNAYTDYTGPGLANYGTNMTGSVTFNVDTSALSGGPDLTTGGDVLSLIMKSGLFVFDQTSLFGDFSFTNGNITGWQVFFSNNFISHNGVYAFGSSTAGVFGDAVTDLGLSGLGSATSEHCGPDGTNIPACAGTWSMVTSGVPEPSTWAMMLIGFAGVGFVGYLRAKKRSTAIAPA
jgi:hypothetical protein